MSDDTDRATGFSPATLRAVLELIIPASADRRLPSAAQFDVWADVDARSPAVKAAVEADLERLEQAAQRALGGAFHDAPPAARKTLVDDLRAADPAFLAELARQTVMCYYRQDPVLEALGLEARAPFPKGHDVEPGDLSLLDPVRRRGKLYRDVDA